MNEDRALFHQKTSTGFSSVLTGANEIFGPSNSAATQAAAQRFANSLDELMSKAPLYTPDMEDTLDKSRESVRQFIKTASQLFGNISITLESAILQNI